ncbi:DUF4262 domain-containing protein [Microbacterium jejuense]|uniref:DUF4262 domain-containing protein n=1 Tax=Microbacterium jejuense TaxID=1263637 RepID=UPI0031EC3E85
MTTALTPSSLGWLDQEDRRTAQTIRAHGTSNEYVFGDLQKREAPYAYTIGLFGLGHPELLVFGLDPRTSALLLDDVSARVRAGEDLRAGQILAFAGWRHRVAVEVVPNPGEIVFAANSYYERADLHSVPVFQLTYDDRDGRFPWDDGYDTAAWLQPRPGTFRA